MFNSILVLHAHTWCTGGVALSNKRAKGVASRKKQEAAMVYYWVAICNSSIPKTQVSSQVI
jgi:hypothetical protein